MRLVYDQNMSKCEVMIWSAWKNFMLTLRVLLLRCVRAGRLLYYNTTCTCPCASMCINYIDAFVYYLLQAHWTGWRDRRSRCKHTYTYNIYVYYKLIHWLTCTNSCSGSDSLSILYFVFYMQNELIWYTVQTVLFFSVCSFCTFLIVIDWISSFIAGLCILCFLFSLCELFDTKSQDTYQHNESRSEFFS